MQRKHAAALLPIIKAFSEGKTIQYNPRPDILGREWSEVSEAINFTESPDCYRVKPEPAWRPWTPKEVPTFFMVGHKEGRLPPGTHCMQDNSYLARQIDPSRVYVVGWGTFSLEALFTEFMKLGENGETRPCGVLESK